MTTITLALSKGRIFEETLPLLAAAGIQPTEDPERSRKLIIATNRPDVRLIIVRATDVPTYVQHGRPTWAWPARTCSWNTVARASISRWTSTSPAAA